MKIPPNLHLIVLCAKMKTVTKSCKIISSSGKANDGWDGAVERQEGLLRTFLPLAAIRLADTWHFPGSQLLPRLPLLVIGLVFC